MGFFTKSKEKEPGFYVSATNMKTINYKVYYMNLLEKSIYFLIAFVAGAAVGYLFYGGIGKDEFGNPTQMTRTLDLLISGIVGTAAAMIFLPARTEQIIEKRRRDLILQFRELLDSLTTSLGSGKNILDSFKDAEADLKAMYDDNAYIIKELKVIMAGSENNVSIESMLMDFGNRSGVDDVESFANVFETCYRKGGNIRDVIKNTKQIISDKIEIEMKIQTIITGSKTEQKIMMVMPIALIGIIKMMSPEFTANFVTPAGLIATTVAVVFFVIAYFVGKVVLDIKI